MGSDQQPILAARFLLLGVVVDVTVEVDHLSERQVHDALFIEQNADHSHRLRTQVRFLEQVVLWRHRV